MGASLKVAVVQLSAGSNKAKNVRRAIFLARSAAAKGAKFILLPEIFNARSPIDGKADLLRVVEAIPGPSTRPLIELAARYKIFILAGSILERTASGKAYNTSVLISPQGKITARYRKQNLFDARIGAKTLKESRFILRGGDDVTVDVFGFKVGLSICYDLRFTSMYDRLRKKGAEIICVPSSFTAVTGKAHWEVLLRSRAIENQCYVLAPNQAGRDGKGVKTYGHSMIIDPWGRILRKAGYENERLLTAVLSKKNIVEASKKLPSIRN
jgi:predicted amidohydrolase